MTMTQWSRLGRRRTLSAGLALALLFALPITATAQTADDSADAKAPEPAEAEKKWLIEEETGRRYTIERLPKVEGTYRRVSETDVRFPGGATFEVIEEDEEWFAVKAFENISRSVAPPPKPEGPPAEEVERIQASYQADSETVDQLKFERFDKGLPRSGQWRNGFDLADMNGDGHLDVVFGPSRKGRAHPNVFLGDGKGNWQTWKAQYPQAPYDYGDVAVGDFDGDGKNDLVFGIHLRGLLVLRAVDGQSFEAWSEGVEIDVPGAGGDATSFSSRAVETIDWNGDGKMDILALGEGPKGLKTRPDKDGQNQLINTSRGFLVYVNNGDGSWTAQSLERTGLRRANFGDDFAYGDIDGDGKMDLVTTTRQLDSQEILATQGDGGLDYQAVDAVRPKGFVDSVELGDMNNDGRLDIVLSYRSRELKQWRTGIDILYSGADGKLTAKPLVVIDGQGGLGALELGNINQDDRLDVVAADSNGALWVFTSKGKDSFHTELSPELDQNSRGCRGFELTLADLDGEPGDELVAAFAGEQTGYPGIPQANKPGCRSRGSIRAWKVTPAP